MRCLVVAEHDGFALNPAINKVVGAARCIAAAIDVLVIGDEPGSVVEAAAAIEGVARVKVARSAHLKNPLAEDVAEIVVAQAQGYSHILAAASPFGRSFLPRVAAVLDVAQVSDVVAIESPDTFVRPIYAGSALAVVQSTDSKKVLSIRTVAFEAVGAGSDAEIEPVGVPPAWEGSSFVSRDVVQSTRPELNAASIVVSGGRGLGSAENFRELLEPLADALHAALGASRAAVDAGFVPNDHQVGQTGKVVAPSLYIAVGISGAIQHLAGMKDSKVIVAINKDAEAPIFGIADYGLVGDLFELVPQLTERLA